MRATTVMALLLLAVPSSVLAAPIVLSIVNNSSSTVEGLNTYPLDEAGHYIEDNIGGFYAPVPPGETGVAELSTSKCGNVLAVVALKGGEELRATVNTCKQTSLVVND